MYLHVHFLSCFLTSKKKWIERIGGKSSFKGEFWIYIPVVKHLQIFIVSNVEYTKKLASLFKWKLYKCKMVNCKMHKIFRFTFVKQSAVLCWRTEHYELQPWNILTFIWWVCVQIFFFNFRNFNTGWTISWIMPHRT